MTCHEFWERLPELESQGQPLEHAFECPSCAAIVERQYALTRSLGRLAEQSRSLEAPAYLEERLVAAFRANRRAPIHIEVDQPHSHWRRWAGQISAAAAILLFAAVLTWWRTPKAVVTGASLETAASAESEGDFIPLPYAVESVALEDANFIRVEMPRSALIAMGVPLTDGDAAEPVEAELMLGAGGAPEAVRILQ